MHLAHLDTKDTTQNNMDVQSNAVKIFRKYIVIYRYFLSKTKLSYKNTNSCCKMTKYNKQCTPNSDSGAKISYMLPVGVFLTFCWLYWKECKTEVDIIYLVANGGHDKELCWKKACPYHTSID